MTLTDDRARGLSIAPVDELRYDHQLIEPGEMVEAFLRVIPRNARILDVGCGTGSISALLRDHLQVDIVGFEPNVARAKAAASRGIRVFAEELDADTLKDLGEFDVVLFADVLEHLVEPAAMLEMVAPALAPGGCVITSVPNIAHWAIRLDLLRGRFNYQPTGIMDATHLRWFTAETLNRLFTAAGYRVVDHSVTIGAWQSVYFGRRPWRWMNPQRRQRILMSLTRKFPNLFGCQFVVKAVVAK
jgi:methionine biosynthesis protein MetW